MKKQLLRFALYPIITYFICGTLNPAVAASQPSVGRGTHFCGVIDYPSNRQHSDQYPNRRYARTSAANLDVGEPRTVRMIYFLPNDRPPRADVVQKMKDEIRIVQNFFANQMGAHGYGNKTFRLETDSQGAPLVHRVDGQYPDNHYLYRTEDTVFAEIEQAFDVMKNIYFIVIDNSIDAIGWGEGRQTGGFGGRRGKSGLVLVSSRFGWQLLAHVMGHGFGLWHDFHDGAYIMSYGPGLQDRLSPYYAEYLSVHPYFNLDVPLEEGQLPTIELISPRAYPAGSKNVSIQLRVSDSEGLHQVLLLLRARPPHPAAGSIEVKTGRRFTGEKDAVVEFDYDGVIPSDGSTSLSKPVVHPISVEAIDMNGNVGQTGFVLFSKALQPLSKISGDNQHGLPNTPLPSPFIVELRDLNDGSARRNVSVTFTVTAGGGTLSVERAETDYRGRAESTLTLGPNLGTNTVEVSAAGMTVTFNAVAGTPVDIPNANLRAVIEDALGKAPGTPIAPAEMVTLTRLEARNANISDLTGLEGATNLKSLRLEGEEVAAGTWNNSNSVSDLSPLAGLTRLEELDLWKNSVSDISPVANLTHLIHLGLGGNSISDISALAGLTNIKSLFLDGNNITDISSVTGLTNLTRLGLDNNPISDISALAGLTNLTWIRLQRNRISDISPVAGLTNLTWLRLGGNSISDIAPVTGLTNLKVLSLWANSISDILPAASLTDLTDLNLSGNSISDISPVAGLPNLTWLHLQSNSISDISPVAGLMHLTALRLDRNSISDISALSSLTQLKELRLDRNNITDLSPLVVNTGLGKGDEVNVGRNPLSYQSIRTHIPALQSREVTVEFDNHPHPALLKISGDNQKGASFVPLPNLLVVEVQDAKGSALAGVSVTFAVTAGGGTLSTTLTRTDENGRAQSTLTLGPNLGTNTAEVSAAGIEGTATFHAIADTFPTEYLWSVPAGISLIHVPLKVTVVDGVAQTITSIVDLYDALGGVGAVNFLITYDSQAQEWRSYFGTSDTGTPADKRLTDDIGIIAGMIAPASIRLSGTPLGINGTSTITLNQGLNLVGLPLRDLRITRVSDLFTLEGIGGNVPVIILTNNGEFKAVGRARDSGDIEIIGGQSFIMTAQREAMITISGDGWYNSSAMAAAPPVGNADLHSIITGIQVTDTTPVLVLRGSIVNEGTGVNQVGTRITVKNLSTGRELATVTAPDGTDYRLAVVDIETGQAAQIGDILEISAQSPIR